jgi:iron(III) transport system permease protein
VFLAILFQRWDFPLKRLCKVAVLAPFALPPLIGAEAFNLLYGIGGTIPHVLERILKTQPNTLYLCGFSGVLLMHTLTMYPYFYLITSAALAQTDDSIEEAAYSLGASTFDTWRRVLLPMLTPAVVSGALLTFMSSMASLTAPQKFGYDNVMTKRITEAQTNAYYETDLSFIAVISVILAAVSVFFLVIMRTYERRRVYRTQSKGGARKRRQVTGRFARTIVTGVAFVSMAFLSLPIAMILLMAFQANGAWTAALLPAQYTLRNFSALVSDRELWTPIQTSLEMSAIAVVGTVLLAVPSAYAIGRMRFRGKGILDIAIMLPWALPGTVVAINLVTAFAKPSVFTFGKELLGTFPIVPLAYFVRFSPLVFRSTTAALEQTDPTFEDAARSLGCSWWCAFRRVVLPLLYRGIAAGALLAFVGGVGEYVATVLLHSADYPTLSIAIERELSPSGSGFGRAYALGSVQVLLVVLFVIVAQRIERHGRTIGIS